MCAMTPLNQTLFSLLLLLCIALLLPIVVRKASEDALTALFGETDQTRAWKDCRSLRPLLRPGEDTLRALPQDLKTKSGLDVLVVVHSDPTHFRERSVIRATWANKAEMPEKVFVTFFLGTPPFEMGVIDLGLMQEMNANQDMTIASFVDAPANGTLKTAMMLKALTEESLTSADTKFILKVDDDSYVDLPVLLREVVQKQEQDPELEGKEAIIGQLVEHEPPTRWALPLFGAQERVCPKWMCEEDVLPGYLKGFSYLIPHSQVSCLYQKSLRTPMIHLEDVFITGILADKCDIPRSDSATFDRGDGDCDAPSAVIKVRSARNMLSYHDSVHRCKALLERRRLAAEERQRRRLQRLKRDLREPKVHWKREALMKNLGRLIDDFGGEDDETSKTIVRTKR